MISTRRLRGSATPSAVATRQLPLPASDGQDVLGRDAVADQPGPDDFGALLRQRVVDLVGAHRIGVPHDHHVGHRALRDFREDRIHLQFGLLRQFVLPFDEVDREPGRACRLRRERRAEERLDFLRIRFVRLRAGRGELRGGIGLAQHDLRRVALLDDDRGVLAVLLREQHDGAGLRGAGIEEHRHQGDAQRARPSA